MDVIRGSAGRILLLMAVINLLLAVALFGLRSPVRVAQEAIWPRPELPVQMRQLQDRIEAGRHGEPYTLDLTEAEMTDLVGYLLYGRSDLPFAQVRVALRDRRVVLDGVTRGLALTLPVRVTGTAGARNGVPWARVEDVSLGDTQVPGFVRDEIVRQANAGLDLSRYNLAVTVDSLELRAGALAVRGTIK